MSIEAIIPPANTAPVKLAVPAGRSRARRLIPIYLFILPATAVFLLWTLYPLGDALLMSFYHWNLAGPSQFIGFNNYERALQDPVFWQAMRNICLYAIISVPGQMVFGLGAALLLDQKIRFRALFRTLFYLPVITSWVVVAVIFLYLYNGQLGLIDYLLVNTIHVIPGPVYFLGDVNWALPSIAILDIWKGIGWTMVIFLAALQGIPQQLYEAAKVDGAGAFQRLRKITIPLLRPAIAFLVVVLTIGAFNSFTQIYVMTTSGGPGTAGGPLNSTESVLTFMYLKAFYTVDFGYGAAISYMYAFFILVISVVQISLLRRRYEY
ncbi:MAG TPA: sugar ABC transporter permease [Chloroflexota bacterium]|nr:sugar ABC transporter permease [Chloroflexota bacterium]